MGNKDKLVLKKLKNKIKRSYVLEQTCSGQEYRLYFTEKQVDKIIKSIQTNLTAYSTD